MVRIVRLLLRRRPAAGFRRSLRVLQHFVLQRAHTARCCPEPLPCRVRNGLPQQRPHVHLAACTPISNQLSSMEASAILAAGTISQQCRTRPLLCAACART